jgi:hypothetical protein
MVGVSCIGGSRRSDIVEFAMKSLAIGLSVLIGFHSLGAQTPTQALPTQLNIVVIEGEGATNNVRQRVARDPVVQVEDENHKPVVGAVVVFTLPTEGATGEFGRGAKTLTVLTDAQGRAAAQGLKFNDIAGKVPIHVNASYRSLTARASIMQYSVLPPGAKQGHGGGGHGTLIAVLVALGAAAAAGGAYFATHQNTQSSTPPVTPPGPTPIGITPGTGSIAGGH